MASFLWLLLVAKGLFVNIVGDTLPFLSQNEN